MLERSIQQIQECERKIVNLSSRITASIHYKVCDEFACTVYDVNNEEVGHYYEYVPSFMCPASEGYGDYIIMNINEYGFIEDWSIFECKRFLAKHVK